jgi:hypothetical protein
MAPDTNAKTPEEMDPLDAWVESARRELADLLLNRGLYQRVEINLPAPLVEKRWTTVLPPRIHRDCETCAHAGQTTWSLQETGPDRIRLHSYRCMSCENASVTFMLTMTPLSTVQGLLQIVEGVMKAESLLDTYAVEKVGQYPAWEAPLSRTLSKALGKEGKSLFIKGASSLRAGRGIGAVAYFRRIIENHVDDILKMVADSAAAAGDTAAIAQIKEANSKLPASDRLKIAATHTPLHLKPGGHSPLDVMYGAFSEGLHALSDEDSAKIATDLLESITYFFEMWQESKERAERFAQAITKAATKTS